MKIRTLLVTAGLLCGLAPVASPQVSPGVGMYREDSVHSDTAYGIFPLAVRRAVGTGLCGTDGDYCAIQVDANGALHVVFTNATLAVTGTVAATQSGTWTVQPGNTANVTAWLVTGTGGTFPVTGTIACSNCSGSGASAVDDAAFGIGTDSVAPAGFLFDDAAPDSVNEGDVGLGRMSANRNQYFTLRDAAGNERGANVSAGNALLVDGSATTQPVSGTVTVTDGSGALNVIVDSSALPSGAATETSVAASATSLAIMDDWDESDRAKVNPIVGQAGVQGGAGASSATTQRVAIATDANAVDRTAVAAANTPGSCVTVDGTNDTVLASFSTRRGGWITNAGTVQAFVKYGATATTSSFPFPPGGVINLAAPSVYTGIIDAITASSSTSICVVEF